MKLSVVIPVYNEDSSFIELLRRVQAIEVDKEIIVVDDGSDHSTRKLYTEDMLQNCRLILHERNQGKGAAIRTGISHATGDVVIIQDADLEYYPEDYVLLLNVYQETNSRAVYGVRNLARRSFVMRWGNRFLTLLTNLLYNTSIKDMETCYKLIDRNLIQSLQLETSGFDTEAEITAKLLRLGVKIAEVPIRYNHREADQGKKLTIWDGIPTVKALVKYWFWKPNSAVKAPSTQRQQRQ